MGRALSPHRRTCGLWWHFRRLSPGLQIRERASAVRRADPRPSPGFAEVLAAPADSAPEELSAIANVMPAPPLAFVPAEQHG